MVFIAHAKMFAQLIGTRPKFALLSEYVKRRFKETLQTTLAIC